MHPAFTERPECQCWPFWVLELTPQADNSDIEKAARDILAKIQFGIAKADTFVTPMGDFSRDDYLIREAKAKLQDPSERLLAEFWYVDPVIDTQEGEQTRETNPTLPQSQQDWIDYFRVDR